MYSFVVGWEMCASVALPPRLLALGSGLERTTRWWWVLWKTFTAVELVEYFEGWWPWVPVYFFWVALYWMRCLIIELRMKSLNEVLRRFLRVSNFTMKKEIFGKNSYFYNSILELPSWLNNVPTNQLIWQFSWLSNWFGNFHIWVTRNWISCNTCNTNSTNWERTTRRSSTSVNRAFFL